MDAKRNKIPIHFYGAPCPGDQTVGIIVIESLVKQYPGKFQISVEGIYATDLYRNNPHVIPKSQNKDAHRIKLGHELIHKSHVGHSFAFSMCYYVQNEIKKVINDPAFELLPQFNKPKFYMNADEVKDRPIAEPYLMGNFGRKDNDGQTKWYPYWPEVCKLLYERCPKLKIVQVGESWHNHQQIEGPNMLNMVGQWNGQGRKPIHWAYHSVGGIGPISFLMHVMAGHSKPYICAATGYEPPTWACNYLGQKYVSRFGSMKCCAVNGCWKRLFKDCVRMHGQEVVGCLDIPPEEFVDAFANYVEGGAIQL